MAGFNFSLFESVKLVMVKTENLLNKTFSEILQWVPSKNLHHRKSLVFVELLRIKPMKMKSCRVLGIPVRCTANQLCTLASHNILPLHLSPLRRGVSGSLKTKHNFISISLIGVHIVSCTILILVCSYVYLS